MANPTRRGEEPTEIARVGSPKGIEADSQKIASETRRLAATKNGRVKACDLHQHQEEED